jgi:hypothetical protein
VNRSLVLSLALLAGCLTGCDEGVSATHGVTEPIQVRYPSNANLTKGQPLPAQFFPGSLPEGTKGPALRPLDLKSFTLFAGQANKKITADAAQGAGAVALRFADLGTGYWLVPTGAVDMAAPQAPGDLTWEADCDFAANLPVGSHDLIFAAVSGDGVWGPQISHPFIVDSVVPVGKVVISLVWDSAADLDLHVMLPDGKNVSPKSPVTQLPDGGSGTNNDPYNFPPGTGVFDRDSNGRCVPDNLREEDLVFADQPPPGTYLLYVDMFSSCGAPSADFVVTVRKDGLVTDTIKGRLLDIDADNGAVDGGVPGLFVAQESL